MDAPKRVVIRVESQDFDIDSRQQIVRIAQRFLESCGFDRTSQHNHFVHAEQLHPEPGPTFLITLDINYRNNNTPDMQTLPLEFFTVNKNLEFEPLELGPLEPAHRHLINNFYEWGRVNATGQIWLSSLG